MNATFQPNDEVHLRGHPEEVGIVRSRAQIVAGTSYYGVFFGGKRGTVTCAAHDLVPHVRHAGPLEALASGILGGAEAFQQAIALQRLARKNPLRNNILAFNASRTRFYPYQFKPLLKLLESRRQRLLIADEVGLGKTIEAGLILIELKARQDLRLCLVVCPAALLMKWQDELSRRFGERFRVLRSPELHEFLDTYEQSPDRTELSGIVSVETLRHAGIRERLEALRIPFDFVVVDEAHVARNPTATRKAIELVGSDAGTVVFLTATPIHLGDGDLFSLLNLLDPEDFPDLETSQQRFRDNESIVAAQALVARPEPDLSRIRDLLEQAAHSPWLTRDVTLGVLRDRFAQLALDGISISHEERVACVRDLAELNMLSHILTRTRKRDVHFRTALRQAVPHAVRFAPHEQALYESVTAFVEARTRESLSSSAAWHLTTPQRLMASSIHGLVELLRTSSPSWLDAEGDDSLPGMLEDPTGEGSAADAPLLAKEVHALVESFPLDVGDAKYEVLREVLGSSVGKVLLFASFRHTLRYLQRRLRADGIPCEMISGLTDPQERQTAIARFRDDPQVRVMLSSRVGSEGLDFQFCSTLVNYDLPWNPMEVEQRIGRLDRLGQEAEKIAIVNLWAEGTVEERILRRLYDRIGIFERSIGELESILGEDVALELQSLLNPQLTEGQIQARSDRLLLQLEQRRQALRDLEEGSARFVGIDGFFDDEVAAIAERRRYVTPRQLRRLVETFIRKRCPLTRLDYNDTTARGMLQPDAELRHLLVAHGYNSSDTDLIVAAGQGIPITFDAQVAEAEAGRELIRALHPMVQMIAAEEEGSSGSGLAFDLVLRTDVLPEGIYFFGVFKTMVRAARRRNVLEMVILDEELREACDADVAEQVLGQLSEDGQSAQGALPDEVRTSAAQAVEVLRMAYLGRSGRLREREAQGNEAFVSQRITSLVQHYAALLSRDRGLLAQGERKGSQERYLRMLRGRIARREQELAEKTRELDKLRNLVTEHVEVAAGVLEVVR